MRKAPTFFCLRRNSEMDVESLQNSGHRRSSCLNVFLVASVIFLLVAVAALATGGVMFVHYKLQPPIFDFERLKSTGHAPYPESKMQNFAYLRANSSKLENSTMHWAPIYYSDRVSVGSNFQFMSEQQSLKLLRGGVYFMFIELNLTCISLCSAAHLRVRVGDELTCEVQVPAGETRVTRKCWALSPVSGSLVARMIVPEGGLPNWKLDLKGSGFGMLLVD